MFFVLLVKWSGGGIGIHAAFKPQSIWLWVRVPPGLQNTPKLGSETSPNSEVKKIKKYFTKCLVDQE